MKILSATAITILCLLSCSKENKYLREALNAAGDNRAELEYVLEHYRTVDNDPQKLEAAKFLIKNLTLEIHSSLVFRKILEFEV